MNDSDGKPLSPFKRLSQKLAASRFLTTSLVIHMVLISILGTVVIFKTAQQQTSFEASVGAEGTFLDKADAGAEIAEEEAVEFEEPTVAPAQETASVSASAISSVTESTASWSTGASMDTMTMGNSLTSKNLSSSLDGAAGGKVGSSAGGGGGKMSGNLFGVKVEAAKLGVILDVSGSAHGVLLHALNEIDRSFKEAEIVLYPGCGMSGNSKSRDYDIKSAKSVSKEFDKEAKENRVVFGQIAMWISKNPSEDTKIKKVLRGKNTYVSVNDPQIQQTAGCQFAFEHLIKDGADTIYWFADFADPIDKKVAEDLAQSLQKRGIKVIAHNFAGKPVRPEAMVIVNATGGQAISQIPGKEKKK